MRIQRPTTMEAVRRDKEILGGTNVSRSHVNLDDERNCMSGWMPVVPAFGGPCWTKLWWGNFRLPHEPRKQRPQDRTVYAK